MLCCRYESVLLQREGKAQQWGTDENHDLLSSGRHEYEDTQRKKALKAATACNDRIQDVFANKGVAKNVLT